MFSRGLRVGDFDGDGNDDLAVSSPNEDVGAVVDGGVVFAIYGGSNSLDPSSGVTFHQATTSVAGTLEANDRFGSGL